MRRGDPAVKPSSGGFGPHVGVPRILELLRQEGIPATWFVPGHTLVTFPDSIGAILGGGQRMAMLEAFIAEARPLPGVVFDRLDRYVAGWTVAGSAGG